MLCLSPEGAQFVAEIDRGAVQEHVEDGVGRTRVVRELVGEPDALSGGVVEVGWAVSVLAPHEAEDESVWAEMVDGPWLDVVEFDELEAVYAELAG